MKWFIISFFLGLFTLSGHQNADAQINHIVVSETKEQKSKKTDLLTFQKEWARIVFEEKNVEKQAQSLQKLIERVEAVLVEKQTDAELRIWLAKLKMEQAQSLGLFNRDSLNKQALELLEQAVLIDPKALDGYGYTMLGHLYHMADRWPFSFGNRVKAKGYFLKALALDPKGLEPNYFYGLYQKEFEGLEAAKPYFEKALQAKQYLDRKVAYEGIKNQVRNAMKDEDTEKKDKKNNGKR